MLNHYELCKSIIASLKLEKDLGDKMSFVFIVTKSTREIGANCIITADSYHDYSSRMGRHADYFHSLP